MRPFRSRRAAARRRAQGFAARFRRGDAADVEATIRRLTAVQLDSISAVDRAHRLTLGARIGAYPRDTVAQLLARGARSSSTGRTRRRCCRSSSGRTSARVMDGGGHWGSHDRALREHADLVEPVLGPHPRGGRRSARATSKARAAAAMWNWKPAKMVLEALWDRGRARDRRPAELPAPLRPRRARDPGARARRADADRGRDAARARRCSRSARAAR